MDQRAHLQHQTDISEVQARVREHVAAYQGRGSNMMSVHLKGRGSAWDISVSLTSVDMVSWLVKCCWMSPFPTVCRGSLHVVTALLSAIVILHVRLGDRRCIKCCDGKTVISVYHLYSSPLF